MNMNINYYLDIFFIKRLLDIRPHLRLIKFVSTFVATLILISYATTHSMNLQDNTLNNVENFINDKFHNVVKIWIHNEVKNTVNDLSINHSIIKVETNINVKAGTHLHNILSIILLTKLIGLLTAL